MKYHFLAADGGERELENASGKACVRVYRNWVFGNVRFEFVYADRLTGEKRGTKRKEVGET